MSITIAVGLLAIFLATRSSNGQVQREMVVADDLPETWISDLFYQALANFTVWDVGSSACRVQSDLYDRHLRNHTSWAVRSEYNRSDYVIQLHYYNKLLNDIDMFYFICPSIISMENQSNY